ncbi:superoxide dismutase [Porphyromonas macacae]|uniref:Superoxide dismutase n=1 Tax=Porphyromonas macacae TaxID=28115 RepID=A0A379DKK9_9PORP|nr:superoxide dismutase [Porphyromonas macacae]SUB78563.1 Superoxide dismutase [Mn/Fe] [Porphyromonas macacae]
MKHELVTLPYAKDSLAPVIGKDTIEYHHGKHLQNYVNTLNTLIEGTEFAEMSLEDIVRKSDGAIFNNAGQTLNHNLYFLQFTPKGEGKPEGTLLKAIEEKWGSFEKFREEFQTAGTKLFGSGWVWLYKDNAGKLGIGQYPNAGNPVKDGYTPLMGIDVWEHAYYLDYQNRRADHLKDVWNIISWKEVAKRF